MDMLIFSGSPPKRNSLMVCVILNVGVWPAALVPFKCLPSLALWKQLSAKMTAALHRTIAGVSLQDGLTLFRDLALLVFSPGRSGNDAQAQLEFLPGFMFSNR